MCDFLIKMLDKLLKQCYNYFREQKKETQTNRILFRKGAFLVNKNIYSFVLSDDVIEAVDRLAATERISRSAMVNKILAERVAYVTPEMRLKSLLESINNAMTSDFFPENTNGSTLMVRTSLRYRYKPTIRYSVEINSVNGNRVGELKVFFRTQNEGFISDITDFFRLWTALEQKYISDRISHDIICEMTNNRFTRTLNLPEQDISDEELGTAIADYIEMFDNTMKQYFAQLPNSDNAKRCAAEYYSRAIAIQPLII